MKIYTPEEVDKGFIYHKIYPYKTKVPTLLYPEGSDWNNNKYSDEVSDLVRQKYYHDKLYILEALDQCTYPYKDKLFENLDLYFTSYPHADHINAAASKNGIVFYGRGTQIPKGMSHYIAMHELGHVFDYRFVCCDDNKLSTYYELRNWDKEEVDDWGYNDKNEYVVLGKKTQWKSDHDLPWQDKIVERFAEDFRYLFGGELAKQDYWGMKCDPPDEKIKEFMVNVASG